MPLGCIARMDTGDFEGHDVVAQQRDNPANGTNQPLRAFTPPVHRFRKVEFEDQVWQSLREYVAGLATLAQFAKTEVVAFCGWLHAEGFYRHSHFLREPRSGARSR